MEERVQASPSIETPGSVNVFRVFLYSYLRLVDRPVLFALFGLALFILINHINSTPTDSAKIFLRVRKFEVKFRALKGFVDWLIDFLEKHQVLLSLIYLLFLPYFIYQYDRYLLISALCSLYAYITPSLVLDHLLVSQLYYLYARIPYEAFRLVLVVLIGFVYVYGVVFPNDAGN